MNIQLIFYGCPFVHEGDKESKWKRQSRQTREALRAVRFMDKPKVYTIDWAISWFQQRRVSHFRGFLAGKNENFPKVCLMSQCQTFLSYKNEFYLPESENRFLHERRHTNPLPEKKAKG